MVLLVQTNTLPQISFQPQPKLKIRWPAPKIYYDRDSSVLSAHHDNGVTAMGAFTKTTIYFVTIISFYLLVCNNLLQLYILIKEFCPNLVYSVIMFYNIWIKLK